MTVKCNIFHFLYKPSRADTRRVSKMEIKIFWKTNPDMIFGYHLGFLFWKNLAAKINNLQVKEVWLDVRNNLSKVENGV